LSELESAGPPRFLDRLRRRDRPSLFPKLRPGGSAARPRWSLPIEPWKILASSSRRQVVWTCRIQETGLCAGVEVDLQGVVVRPRDMQTPRLTDDAADPERLALQACRIIFVEIPAIGDAPGFGIDRKTLVIALSGRCHAVTPVFAHYSNQ